MYFNSNAYQDDLELIYRRIFTWPK